MKIAQVLHVKFAKKCNGVQLYVWRGNHVEGSKSIFSIKDLLNVSRIWDQRLPGPECILQTNFDALGNVQDPNKNGSLNKTEKASSLQAPQGSKIAFLR